MNYELTHSYSTLKLFEQCPKRYWFQRLRRPRLPDPGSAASAYGERVHAKIEKYLRGEHDVVPDELVPIKHVLDMLKARGATAEREVALTRTWAVTGWYSPDAWLRAKLDASIIGGGVGLVIDWKTGKRVVDQDQLELFSLVLMTVHPEVRRTYTAFVWLREMAIDSDWYPRSSFDAMRGRLMAKIERVEHAASIDQWPARPSRLCRWCPARHLCPDAE